MIHLQPPPLPRSVEPEVSVCGEVRWDHTQLRFVLLRNIASDAATSASVSQALRQLCHSPSVLLRLRLRRKHLHLVLIPAFLPSCADSLVLERRLKLTKACLLSPRALSWYITVVFEIRSSQLHLQPSFCHLRSKDTNLESYSYTLYLVRLD